MKKRRSYGEIFGMAFLDVVTCGFGAIVLLLLISRPAPPDAGDAASTPAQAREIEEAEALVARLRSRWEALRTALAEEAKRRPAPVETSGEDPAPGEALRAAGRELEQLRRENRGLVRVRESLRRAAIRARTPVSERAPEVGGIPVDGEYVIFIVDTSGSMKSIWDQVMDVMDKALDIHPKVRGFQVLNDNGDYLVRGYRGKWIPDTPGRRKSILEAVRIWGAFSNSSPVEGLRTALRTYAGRREKIAVYIFGDDYTGSSYDQVIETLRELNTDRRTGKSKVRVHAVGFISAHSTERYATLMRAVAGRNDGTFLALPIRDVRSGGLGVPQPDYRDGALRRSIP